MEGAEMSYEGYEQVICENGHYHTESCYTFDSRYWWCPDCNTRCLWWNSVNETNGTWDEDENGDPLLDENGKPIRIDNYIELEIDKPATFESCPTCGHQKVIQKETYKIPQGQGHIIQLDMDLGECEDCGSPDDGKCVCDPFTSLPPNEEEFGTGLHVYEDPNKDIVQGFKVREKMGKPVIQLPPSSEEEFGVGL